MGRKVTINMVAKRAGVSCGTVDRVLNQRPHVKPELYDRIVKAMKELGYMPLKAEQAKALGLPLATEIGGTLGIVLPNWGGFFKSEIMRGIRDAEALLSDFSVNVLVEQCESDLPDESIECINRLVQQGARGLAVCAMDHIMVTQKINALSEQGIPVVTFNSDLTDGICQVMADDLDLSFFPCLTDGFHTSCYAVICHIDSLYIRLLFQYRTDLLIGQQVIVICLNDVHGRCVKSAFLHSFLKTDFTIAQNIYQQGYRSLTVLRDYLHKGIVPQDTERFKMDIVCSENMDAV